MFQIDSNMISEDGSRSEEGVYEFFDKHFGQSGNYYDLKKCNDCNRIASAPFLENKAISTDPIKDMERYLHKIIDSDDLDTMESKYDHNMALMNNTQLQIIHEGIKHEMDKEILEKLKEEYDPSSEIILESNWNTDDDFSEEAEENSNKIVNKLYKDLANLTLEDSKEDSLSKKKEDDPVTAAKCPPIQGGQVSSESRPSGMARNMTLGSTTKTSAMSTTTSTPTSSTTTSPPRNPQIIHEKNCYVRSRNRQKLKFSAN